jgi:hypothetical protein
MGINIKLFTILVLFYKLIFKIHWFLRNFWRFIQICSPEINNVGLMRITYHELRIFANISRFGTILWRSCSWNTVLASSSLILCQIFFPSIWLLRHFGHEGFTFVAHIVFDRCSSIFNHSSLASRILVWCVCLPFHSFKLQIIKLFQIKLTNTFNIFYF